MDSGFSDKNVVEAQAFLLGNVIVRLRIQVFINLDFWGSLGKSAIRFSKLIILKEFFLSDMLPSVLFDHVFEDEIVPVFSKVAKSGGKNY